MTLLICSGLLIRTFRHITRLNPGFKADSLLTMMAALPPPAQTGGNRDVLTAREVLARLRTLPSITAAAIGSDLPLGGDLNAAFYTAEGQPIVDAQIVPRGFVHRISPGFFETLRTQFIAGRDFNDVDIVRGAGQVIVTRNLTDRFWPGQDPIGKRIKFGGPGSQNPWLEIIGVVQEMKYRGIPANPTADPDVFLPLPDRQRNIAILLRSSTDPSSSSTAVRASIRALNPFILVYEVAPMEDRVHRAIAPFEFAQWLMSIFAGLALILSVTGLYGVIAYTVRQRTREFGVRIALGATARTIAGDVIRDGMLLTAAGVLCGAFAAAGFVRVIHTLLFDVSPTDPTLFITVSVLLGLASLGACYLPARRAARVDPVVALRYE
jgi:predicted permease